MPAIDITPSKPDPEAQKQANKLMDEYRDSVFSVSRVNWSLGFIPTGYAGGVGFAVRKGTHDGHDFCDIATIDHVLEGLNGTPKTHSADGTARSASILDQNPATGVALLRIEGMEPGACKPLSLDATLNDHEQVVKITANGEKWTAQPGKYTGDISRADYGFKSEFGEALDQKGHLFQIEGAPGDSGAPTLKLSGKVSALTEGGGRWGAMLTVPAEYIQQSLDKTASR